MLFFPRHQQSASAQSEHNAICKNKITLQLVIEKALLHPPWHRPEPEFPQPAPQPQPQHRQYPNPRNNAEPWLCRDNESESSSRQKEHDDVPSRIALIGARGYTGQALIELLDKPPYMDLRHVSSRELAGQELEGYTKRKIVYENLSIEDCAQLDVDAYVLALPNGVCKPYVDAIDQADKD
ncbi:hypothetical protein GGI35DRAFT_492431 [Trichoderma velutinum]